VPNGSSFAGSYQIFSAHPVLSSVLRKKTFCSLILCFPVSSASAERSFSAMRRIKTYLRASMSEQRLSGLAVLSVERELSSALLKEPSAVIDRFAQMGTRRLLLNN